MNSLKTYDGGQPLYLNDIRFMQDAIKESFQGILKAIGDSSANVILYGCEVTVQAAVAGIQTVVWTAGFISIAGEVLRVAAGTCQANLDFIDLYWCVKTSVDAEGNYEFADGSTNSVYQLREAELRNADTSEAYASYKNTKDYRDLLFSELDTFFAKPLSKRIINVYNSGGFVGFFAMGYNADVVLFSFNSIGTPGSSLIADGSKRKYNINIDGLTETEKSLLNLAHCHPVAYLSNSNLPGLAIIQISDSGIYVYNPDGTAATDSIVYTFDFHITLKRA